MAESSFWPLPRVATSYGMFSARAEMTDFGIIWKSRIVVETSIDSCCRGNFESFIRQLHGGVQLVGIYCFDYDKRGPWGTGRTRDDWGRLSEGVRYTTGAKLGPIAVWRAHGGLIAGETAGIGARKLRVFGGFPGDRVICGNDRITVGGRVYIVKSATRSAPDGFDVELFDPLHTSVEAGTPIPLGGRYIVPMRLINRDAGDNLTGPDGPTRFTLDFQQAL